MSVALVYNIPCENVRAVKYTHANVNITFFLIFKLVVIVYYKTSCSAIPEQLVAQQSVITSLSVKSVNSKIKDFGLNLSKSNQY